MEKLFAELGADLKLVVGIEEINNEANKDTLLLIDEADKLFIDDVNCLPKNYKACTGFTATIPSSQESDIVQKRLGKILNFGILGDWGYPDEAREPDEEVDSFEAFFEQSNRCAKLVWCTPGKMLLTEEKATEAGFKVFRNCENLDYIRNMRGRCLIVTDEYLMRGIDYRLKETQAFDGKDGIDLLVACPFSNERAYQ